MSSAVRREPYRFVVKYWIGQGSDWATGYVDRAEADRVIADLRSRGVHAERYSSLDPSKCNTFGGAAADERIRVRDDGTYIPLSAGAS